MDPFLEVCYQSDSWATRHLLEECCLLTQEQFERPLGMGNGTLEHTLTHLVGAMMFFTDRLNRSAPRPRPDRDGHTHSPAELLGYFDVIRPEFYQAVVRCTETHALTDILNWTDSDSVPADPEDQITYAVALAQMLDHSIHHRAQALDMLTRLGVERPMEWHPFEWEASSRDAD